MTSRALHRWLLLALVGCALAASHVRADGKRRSHAVEKDPLADTDSFDDVVSAPRSDAELDRSEAPSEQAASTETDADGASDAASAAPGAEGEGGAEADSLQVEAFAGAGFGTRALERPTAIGAQRMDTTMFPALDAGLRVTGWPGAPFSLDVLLHYQTSLGMSVREQPPFALDNEVDVRAEHVELSAAPTFQLGDGPSALALAFPIGFTLRTFWPEVHHMQTPGYSLGGPLLRAELIAQSDLLLLRIGPEVQWIVMIDHVLTDAGVGAQGVALGGEASLELRVSAVFALKLDYRESHVLAPSDHAGGQSFSDVERFLTLSLSGRL